MENADGKLTLKCELSNYAHYKYSEIRDLEELQKYDTSQDLEVVNLLKMIMTK